MTKWSFFIILFLLFPLSSLAAPFSDVKDDSPFAVPLTYLKKEAGFTGYLDGSFHPERLVTRAEALAFILQTKHKDASQKGGVKIEGQKTLRIFLPAAGTIIMEDLATGEKKEIPNVQFLDIATESGSTRIIQNMSKKRKMVFVDVQETDWFFDLVSQARQEGIIRGIKKNKKRYFKPNEHINLAEALRMLFQMHQINTKLTDAPVPPNISVNEWYAKDFTFAANRTILTQQENGSVFPPDKKLTRGQLAVILYRFLQTRSNVTFGYASWYGDGLAKTKIDRGLEYKEKNLTAAHRTLPFGTILKVTNVMNGKTVKVVVNDRGPFVTGRIVDLSKSAFSALDSPTIGIAQVSIEPQ